MTKLKKVEEIKIFLNQILERYKLKLKFILLKFLKNFNIQILKRAVYDLENEEVVNTIKILQQFNENTPIPKFEGGQQVPHVHRNPFEQNQDLIQEAAYKRFLINNYRKIDTSDLKNLKYIYNNILELGDWLRFDYKNRGNCRYPGMHRTDEYATYTLNNE